MTKDSSSLKRALLAVPLCAALALGACGGNGDFASEADAICEDERDELVDAIVEAPAASAGQGEAVVRAREATLERLRSLQPPPSQAPAYERFLDAREEGLTAIRELAAASERQDDEAVSAAGQEIVAASERAGLAAQDAGLEACG